MLDKRSGPDTSAETFDYLEQRIAELDALPEDSPEASAKRRVLLLALDQHGFFDPRSQPRLRRALWQGPWTRLKAVRAAAQSLTEYLASPERAARFPGAEPPPATAAPVSIDWIRYPGARPDLFADERAWLAWCEAWLQSSRVEASAGRGEAWAHVNETPWVLRWRTDDGVTPALVSATALPG
jgi:hypothetical protein